MSNHEKFEVSIIIEKYDYKNDNTKNIFLIFLKDIWILSYEVYFIICIDPLKIVRKQQEIA